MAEQGSESKFQQILDQLKDIKIVVSGNTQDKAPEKIPLIDPTANVLALVKAETQRQDDLRSAEFKRLDDLRVQAEKFNDKLDTERRRTESDAKKAEADRIDALLSANKNDVALALSKQQAQAEAQDKRIAIVEQNQYQGAGRQGQQTENRQHSQWLIGVAITMALGLGALLVKVLFKS
jgi:hypothetical protein